MRATNIPTMRRIKNATEMLILKKSVFNNPNPSVSTPSVICLVLIKLGVSLFLVVVNPSYGHWDRFHVCFDWRRDLAWHCNDEVRSTWNIHAINIWFIKIGNLIYFLVLCLQAEWIESQWHTYSNYFLHKIYVFKSFTRPSKWAVFFILSVFVCV